MIQCPYKTCHACYSEGYEAEDIRFVYDFLANHEQSVFLDVGAHIGLYIYQLNKLLNGCASCKMIAIEPDFSVYAALRRNASPHNVLCLAAWNEFACLFLSKQGKEIGRMKENEVDSEDFFVMAMPLDVLGHSISFDPYILAAKIDVEGAEHKVLIGMKQTLLACKKGALVVELSDTHLGRYGSSVMDIVAELFACGFNTVDTDQKKLSEACHGYKRNVHFVKG
jgi:FkbM family methyltransferase